MASGSHTETKTLCISVNFIHGCYNGIEWPPSPAKFFCALVAGNRTGCRKLEWGEEEKAAIRWLERLDPPEILVPPYRIGTPYIQYGVNNDEKQGKVEKWKYPHRIQEPLHFLWRFPSGEEEMARIICRMSRRIIALGHGSDSVWVSGKILEDDARPPGDAYKPAMRGERIKVPFPGYYDLLERRWRNGISNVRSSPSEERYVLYSWSNPKPWKWRVFLLTSPTSGTILSFPWSSASIIAAWVRHAAGEALGKLRDPAWIKRVVMGHCEISEIRHRWAYVPLPSVHPKHGDGLIRHVAVLVPDNENTDIVDVLDGCCLTNTGGEMMAVLEAEHKLSPMYGGKSKVWRTVTPVVFPGHWQRRGRNREGRLHTMLAAMLSEAGIEENSVEQCQVRREPFFKGCELAQQAKAPQHLLALPRMHLELVLKEEVQGPMLLGLGRFAGLGCLAGVNVL
ncbi:conserved protein of unknown function [Candidatus Methylacidiphilum fumarolicum]|nr:conserved protein of unknown function [Candidatus Methylacidiphilum fumarolicum]